MVIMEEEVINSVNETYVVLEGGITELHIYPDHCTGVISLLNKDKKLICNYPAFPFECNKVNSIDIIRKSSGNLRLRGCFYNAGNCSFDGSNVVLDVTNAEEI